MLAGQDQASVLEDLILGREVQDPQLLQRVQAAFIQQFAMQNARAIQRRVESLIPSDLPPGLRQQILGQIGRTPYAQLTALVHGLDTKSIAAQLYRALVAYPSPPNRAERRALRPFAQHHPGLRALLHLWNGDMGEWRAALDLLSAPDYAALVVPLLRGGMITSWQVLSPRHVDDWFDICIEFTHTDDIVQVAKALGQCGGAPAVDLLAPYVPQFEQDRQRDLQRWLKRSYRDQAPQLWAALEQALGKPESAMSKLKGWLAGDESLPQRATGRRRSIRWGGRK